MEEKVLAVLHVPIKYLNLVEEYEKVKIEPCGSLLFKRPPKEEREEFKIKTVIPSDLRERRFIGYSAKEKGMRINMPIAEIGRDIFAFPDVFTTPEVLQRQKAELKVKSSTSLQTIFSTTLKSQALTATASVATIISLFALYYGFLYGYWAIVWCGFMTLVIIFVDMWIMASRERKRHGRR